MTWRDKLEIGLKEDAPFRQDNLPLNQVRGPAIDAGPGRSPEIPLARGDRNGVQLSPASAPARRGRVARLRSGPAQRARSTKRR